MLWRGVNGMNGLISSCIAIDVPLAGHTEYYFPLGPGSVVYKASLRPGIRLSRNTERVRWR
ncbi:hypothetical protein BDV27DRAFT_27135 [Aspergillus caelatus]|uniref:Uncharacterized protein n=1 Tax=Aspergillus caelatus TaxID=61420 RepID=A0A5N6ZXE0_9EURO|nr:uncharacterized protein BDV27DRAFT_27135 [Aspergillus caelatus]KAE8361579.1 hypothetical protein BDV27DRAFT_27135 [Aspergillus caelatus]